MLRFHVFSKVIKDTKVDEVTGERPFFDFLESCLRHKSETVIFEAARLDLVSSQPFSKLKILPRRVIIELNEVTTRELQPAVTVLQLFLSSSKPILRFAAIRALNKVAMNNPSSMTNCNIDMESMISDQNRSIATLAITTLLKTGKESSIDRLMKQISTFMTDIQVKYHKLQNEGVIFRTFLF